jgi:hypothetical protein
LWNQATSFYILAAAIVEHHSPGGAIPQPRLRPATGHDRAPSLAWQPGDWTSRHSTRRRLAAAPSGARDPIRPRPAAVGA